MKSEPAGAKHLLRLALVAILCALPFALAGRYLTNHVEQIDTLPFDEYRDLRWTEDGRGLLFLHQPLDREGAPIRTELWLQDARDLKFSQLGELPRESGWKIGHQVLQDSILLERDKQGQRELGLFARKEGGEIRSLEVSAGWAPVPSQGRGLFYVTEEENIPFDQFVDLEAAPEVKESDNPEGSEDGEGLTAPPTRRGVKIGRYEVEKSEVKPLFSIPFIRPEDRPEVLLVRESPDQRFLALVLRFGEGAAGLWVHDAQTSRLLWTRVLVSAPVEGLAWSPDSVGVALTDKEGIALLESALKLESVRFQISGLEGARPGWSERGEILLQVPDVVLRFDREQGRSLVLFDAKKVKAEVSSINAETSSAAYFSDPKGFHEVFLTALDGSGDAPIRATLPGSLREVAQGTLKYQVGEFLIHSGEFWLERLR